MCMDMVFKGLTMCMDMVFKGLKICMDVVFKGLKICMDMVFKGLKSNNYLGKCATLNCEYLGCMSWNG